MKAYTDLEQSKKLAEILPLESADMHYATWTILDGDFIVSPNQGSTIENLQEDYGNQIIPCWSLAALQDIIKINYKLEKTFLDQSDYCTYSLYDSDEPTFRTFEYDNPVDACYEMIIKLHKLKML